MAPKAVGRRPSAVTPACRQAADHVPPFARDAELLTHLAPRRRDRVLATADASARQHPAPISVAVADEHDGIAPTQDAADPARTRPPKDPPHRQQSHGQPVGHRSHSRTHVVIVSAPGTQRPSADGRENVIVVTTDLPRRPRPHHSSGGRGGWAGSGTKRCLHRDPGALGARGRGADLGVGLLGCRSGVTPRFAVPGSAGRRTGRPSWAISTACASAQLAAE
jgi:hypothetical protein